MYEVFLYLHSYVRWAVLILGVLAVGRALVGWLGRQPWDPAAGRLGSFYNITMDVQLLIGLVLYGFLSPSTQRAFADFGTAMGNSQLRFWAVEHIFLMIVAIVLAHVGTALAKRRPEGGRYRWLAIFLGLSLLAVLAAIPWPFNEAVGRPLFRM